MRSELFEEHVLDLTTIRKEPFICSKGISLKDLDMSKWLLFIHDAMIAVAAWFAWAWFLAAWSFVQGGSLSARLDVLLFAGLTIVLFPWLNLYDRHIIFSRRNHIVHLGKAFCGSLLVFGLLFAMYVMPGLSAVHPAAFVVAACVIIASILLWIRLVEDGSWMFVKIVGICLLIVGGLEYIGHGTPITLSATAAVGFGFGAAIVLCISSRMLMVHILFNGVFRMNFRRQVAVIGTGEQAHRITEFIVKGNAPFWVSGIIGGDCGWARAGGAKKNILGALENLPGIVSANHINEILVTDEKIDKHSLICILDFCLSNHITVWLPPNLLEIIDRKLNIDSFCGLPMIKMCSSGKPFFSSKLKHVFDALISLPIFIALLPLFGIVAAAIKLNSPGPVFYKARAIGKMGREFKMLKFRSMRVDNGNDIHKNYVTRLIKGEIEASEGKPLKITDDPRVTVVGKFLRKYSLDELPQIINVITGEMSLIGPRPCLPYEYELYKEWHKRRTSVRPGITGLWQVAGRSEVSFEDMILLDLYYIYNRRMWMDLNILIETVFVVLKKKGAY